ncbi:MFS transporter [Bacillus smithii]|uniref:MFS transporter n=1 Tax=Bacillus smithii TaxID=1479 RepID=UPI003D242211
MDHQSSKLWTKQFIVILLMAFLFFICLQMLTAGYPAFISDIKHNPAQGGLMTTAFMAAAIVTRPFIGILMHKLNVKRMAIFSLIFVLLAIALSYKLESVPILLLLRIFHGIGFGIITTLLSTMATNIIPNHRLGEGIGYYGLSTSLGTSLGPMLALSLMAAFSFHVLIFLSVLFTAIILILSFSIKSSSKTDGKPTNSQAQSLIQYAFDKQALLPCLLIVCYFISLGGVVSFMNELGKEANLGGTVSLFFLTNAIVMTVIRPISGRLYDHFGHKVLIYPAAMAGIIGLMLLYFTYNTATLLIAGFFYGLGYGVIQPSLQALAVSRVAQDKKGTANAMFFSSMDLGIAIGSSGLGVVANSTGYHTMYAYSVLPILLLIMIYTFTFVINKHRDKTIKKAS